jgi:hypothetical protein
MSTAHLLARGCTCSLLGGVWCLMPLSTLSVLLVEETGVPGEYQGPAPSHWQTLSHNHLLLSIQIIYIVEDSAVIVSWRTARIKKVVPLSYQYFFWYQLFIVLLFIFHFLWMRNKKCQLKLNWIGIFNIHWIILNWNVW